MNFLIPCLRDIQPDQAEFLSRKHVDGRRRGAMLRRTYYIEKKASKVSQQTREILYVFRIATAALFRRITSLRNTVATKIFRINEYGFMQPYMELECAENHRPLCVRWLRRAQSKPGGRQLIWGCVLTNTRPPPQYGVYGKHNGRLHGLPPLQAAPLTR